MNRVLEVCLVALVLVPGMVAGQPATATVPPKAFAGTWEGTMNDLPGIQLKIDQADTRIAGTVVFYFQQRGDVSGPWRVAGETAVPLLSPHIEDSTLTFEVEHHRCHGCAELGPNVRFRMQLSGPNEARLWNLSEKTDSDQGLRLVHLTEATANTALTQTAPPLRQGVSVEMAVTNNATPMPAADNEDAWIVAVTADGNLYFGIDPVTLEALADKMRRTPRNREAKLYIKADARAPFDTVEKVLEIARDSFFEAPVLLTSQPQAPTPGTLVPPKGLEVLVGPHPSAGAPVVQVTAQPSSQVKVNNRDTALASLQSTLKQLLQGRSEKLVLVNADGPVAFAHVAQVIDISRSTGAKVVIATPEP